MTISQREKNKMKFQYHSVWTYIHSVYTTINFRLTENTGNHANITLYLIFMFFFQSIVCHFNYRSLHDPDH